MQNIKSAQDLHHVNLIDEFSVQAVDKLSETYSIGITSNVLKTIKTTSNEDAVFKQYVPDMREMDIGSKEDADPIGDDAHEVTRGLVHRYKDRVLFKITPNCAVYCRFCFRRDMVGRGKDILTEDDTSKIYQYIEANTDIREVILSGGDPLILSPRRLREAIKKLEQIDHVKIIRIHTRAPIAKPSLVTQELIKALHTHKKMTIVLHVNHAQEINDDVTHALDALKNSGTLLSQSVLLKNINDTSQDLAALYRKLSECGVTPYYLHHSDKARGTKHFRVSIQKGMDIYAALRGQISGYLLPDYVLDIPGGFGKVPVNSDWIAPHADGGYSVKDIHGAMHRYYD